MLTGRNGQAAKAGEPEIRLLTTVEDMELVRLLEQRVWGKEPTPTHQTFTAAKNGGLVIGAFLDGQLIGFSYGFPGIQEGSTYLYSHMLGIDPDYRQKGLGRKLKEEQAQYARLHGYQLIRWMFDPLEARNAYLNISKLGGIVSTYWEDYYGEMNDEFNSGLPTDRFRIDWWIESQRVKMHEFPKLQEYACPYRTELSEGGHPVLVSGGQPAEAPAFEVPVPAHFQKLKKDDPALALDWRLKTRNIFSSAFAGGYIVTDVRRTDGEVHYYRLIKKNGSSVLRQIVK